MRVLTLKLITNEAFVLLRIDVLIFVTIVKVKNDAVWLIVLKYKGNWTNSFKAFKYQLELIWEFKQLKLLESMLLHWYIWIC